MKKLAQNLIYNGLYQAIYVILPFITLPYIQKVFTNEQIGINSYVNSIPLFLSVLIGMGMIQIGPKIIASSEKEDYYQEISKLWGIQFYVGITTVIAYTIFVLLFLDYKMYFLFEIPYLLGYVFDLSWYFFGTGEAKEVILRNSLIKIGITISIFVFIHSQNDLWIYILINSVIYLANIIFFFRMQKDIHRRIRLRDLTFRNEYLKSSLIVVIPLLATRIYTSFDQTLVKILSGPIELSYYSQVQVLITAIYSVIASTSSIIMPKLAEIEAKESTDQMMKLLKKSLQYTLILSLFCAAALMVNAHDFILWYSGPRYYNSINNLFFASMIVVFIPVGGVFSNQYLLAKGKYVAYTIPTIVAAVVSLVSNYIVLGIFHWGADGATFTICLCEGIVFALFVWLCRKDLDLGYLFQGVWKNLAIFVLIVSFGCLIPLHFSLFINLVIRTIFITILAAILAIALKLEIVDDIRKLVTQINKK